MGRIKASFRVGRTEPHEVEVEAGILGRRIVRVDGREVLDVSGGGGPLRFEVGSAEVHVVEMRAGNSFSLVQQLWIDGVLENPRFLDLEACIYTSPTMERLTWGLAGLGLAVLMTWVAQGVMLTRARPEELSPLPLLGFGAWFWKWGLVCGVFLAALGFIEVLEFRLRPQGRKAGFVAWIVIVIVPAAAAQVGREVGEWAFAAAVLRQGVEREVAQDARAALTEFNRLVSCGLYAEDPGLPYRRGVALARLGESELARKAYGETLRRNPGYVLAHEGLGTVLQGIGDFDGARSAYRKALEVSPPGWEGRARVEGYLEALK